MVISYLARIPDASTFQICEGQTVRRAEPDGSYGKRFQAGQEGRFLAGRFTGKHRDVCAEYYRSRNKRPPYFALAECPETEDSIQEFTAKWGTLNSGAGIPPQWKALMARPGCHWLGDSEDFLMDIEGWIVLKQRFSLWLRAAQEKGPTARAKLLKLIENEGSFSFDGGSFSLGLAWQSSSWLPQIRTQSLYLAFVAMLWLDISARDRMILCCANSKCGRYFTTERPNKKYCDPICGSQVARRHWWRVHGAAWRKNR